MCVGTWTTEEFLVLTGANQYENLFQAKDTGWILDSQAPR